MCQSFFQSPDEYYFYTILPIATDLFDHRDGLMTRGTARRLAFPGSIYLNIRESLYGKSWTVYPATSASRFGLSRHHVEAVVSEVPL